MKDERGNEPKVSRDTNVLDDLGKTEEVGDGVVGEGVVASWKKEKKKEVSLDAQLYK
jgi:hypothetical protein